MKGYSFNSLTLHFFLITATLLTLSFPLGCTSTGDIKNVPPFGVIESSLSRDIIDKEINSIPLGQSTTYYINDKQLVSYIKLKNISGKHKIRWDWHRPDGVLYCTSGSKSIQIAAGNYREQMHLWHRISLQGEPAVNFPGRWLVNIYFDNDVILSKHFEIKPEINIDMLPEIARTPKTSDWGLIIGIENYPDLPNVDYAEKDARLVKDYFEVLIGIPRENIITLIGAEATKSKIEGLLKSYLPMNLDQDTTLFVYFAGHGIPSAKDGDAFIITYDGDPRFIEHTGYKLENLYKDIASLPIKKAIVFIDGCFSGASSRGGQMLISGTRPALLKVEDVAFPTDKIVSFTAAQGDQLSSAYAEKEHGLFTYFMLKGLRGAADADNDESISLNELYTYVKTNVVKASRLNGIEQTPVLFTGTDVLEEINISRTIKE